MQDGFLIDERMIDGFEYPFAFKKAVELNLLDFDLWFILDSKLAQGIFLGMKKMYPKSYYIPFAKRGDNDDCACFEPGKGGRVQIVHYYASEGYEKRETYESFWEWLVQAVRVMIDYNIIEEKYAKGEPNGL